MVKVVPFCGQVSMEIVPPAAATLSRTMLMPTPRPALRLSFFAVVSPGRKISSHILSDLISSASARLMRLEATAFSNRGRNAIPRPSSVTETTVFGPLSPTRIVILPQLDQFFKLLEPKK